MHEREDACAELARTRLHCSNRPFRSRQRSQPLPRFVYSCSSFSCIFPGINSVIDSYYKFRNLLKEKSSDLTEEEHPQLLLCGHGAVDDPDASIIYDQVLQLVESEPYKTYAKDIVVMRLPPSDQCMHFVFFQLFARANIVPKCSTH